LLLSVLPQLGTNYQWTTPQGSVPGPIIFIAPMTSQDQGDYTCIAPIAGCPGSESTTTVLLLTGPAAPVITGNTALCLGDDLVLSVPQVPDVTYTWTTPQGQLSGDQIQVDQAGLNDAGVYSCLPNAGDCVGTDAEVVVTVQAPPDVPVVTGPTALCEGDDISLTVAGFGGAFTWVFPSGTIPGTGPSIWLSGLSAANSGNYGVQVEGGVCADASAFIQIIIDPCEVIIPNVITPNGDGNNDLLILEAPAGSSYAMTIHNRWGQVVWSMSGPVVKWNGTNDQHEMLPEGVYYYVFSRTSGIRELNRTGYIQILHQR
jgi:gliding motility-associated-like protein